MRFLKAFGQSWYDFLIGDDWKIAASVVAVLVVIALLLAVGLGHSLLAVLFVALLAATFTGALLIDARLGRS